MTIGAAILLSIWLIPALLFICFSDKRSFDDVEWVTLFLIPLLNIIGLISEIHDGRFGWKYRRWRDYDIYFCNEEEK